MEKETKFFIFHKLFIQIVICSHVNITETMQLILLYLLRFCIAAAQIMKKLWHLFHCNGQHCAKYCVCVCVYAENN